MVVTDSPQTFPVADENRSLGRIFSWGALIGVLAMTIAGATIWLLLTDPVECDQRHRPRRSWLTDAPTGPRDL